MAEELALQGLSNPFKLVIDPVLVSTSGDALATTGACVPGYVWALISSSVLGFVHVCVGWHMPVLVSTSGDALATAGACVFAYVSACKCGCEYVLSSTVF